MKKKTRDKLFCHMEAVEDEDMPDGAWQQMLEDAAEHWGRENNIRVDGYDAFMEYLGWKALNKTTI